MLLQKNKEKKKSISYTKKKKLLHSCWVNRAQELKQKSDTNYLQRENKVIVVTKPFHDFYISHSNSLIKKDDDYKEKCDGLFN